MTIHVMGKITSHHDIPIDVEGYGALCCDCGAIISCDTDDEQNSLHDPYRAGRCPLCNGNEVCACSNCVKGGPY